LLSRICRYYKLKEKEKEKKNNIQKKRKEKEKGNNNDLAIVASHDMEGIIYIIYYSVFASLHQ